ncbi:MAG: LysR family transcriptional regulator [Alphaproteobacteria bacterium]|nr:LysR family transcriptional regulator [Hyphomonas sp.]MBR9806924.1 LysR family transcriptional regulator [Alphaproteobacteria bacterium]|tara:strand:+ start:144 stop:1037 length:894 start_codon:yes stop_codon:yes gene_type:complete
MDRIDAMRLFVRVAESGSFSKAAVALGVGQPTVSRRIQDLEAQLDAALFQRTTRALSLTEAGERFYKRAVDLIADYEEAEAEVRGLEHEPVGLLRISCSNSFARRIIIPAIPEFADKYPRIRFDVISDDSFTDLVEEGVDLAFRFGHLDDSRLMMRKLADSPQALWASPDYLERMGTPETPADLSNHSAVHFRKARHPEWHLTKDGETVAVQLQGRFIASGGDNLVQAAEAGLGIVLGPKWLVANCVSEGRLQAVLPDWTTENLPVNCVWTSGRLRGKTKLFANHIADALKASMNRC